MSGTVWLQALEFQKVEECFVVPVWFSICITLQNKVSEDIRLMFFLIKIANEELTGCCFREGGRGSPL